MSVEDADVLLGGRKLVHRDRHHIVVLVIQIVLVEVVADPGPVRQQVLDRHDLGDQGQVRVEQRAGGRVELQGPPLHQSHDDQGRQALRPARGREEGLHGVEDPMGTVSKPVGTGDLGLTRAVDADHAGEPGVRRRLVHRVLKWLHPPSLATRLAVPGSDCLASHDHEAMSSWVRCTST